MPEPPAATPDAPRAPHARVQPRTRPRCPRCGAGLGALASADPNDSPDQRPAGGWYCGCCGLVLPAGAAAAGAER